MYQDTNVPRYKCIKIQMYLDTNVPRYKWTKIQMDQDTKFNVLRYK